MWTIIAGSRGLGYLQVKAAMQECPWIPSLVISGGARGVDKAGETWAKMNNIPIKVYPANWNLHGKGAGYIRNEEMAKDAEALVAVWDGQSRGTRNMIEMAHKYTLKIHIWRTG